MMNEEHKRGRFASRKLLVAVLMGLSYGGAMLRASENQVATVHERTQQQQVVTITGVVVEAWLKREQPMVASPMWMDALRCL